MGQVRFVVVGGFLEADKTTGLTWPAQSLEGMGTRPPCRWESRHELRTVDDMVGATSPSRVRRTAGLEPADPRGHHVPITLERRPIKGECVARGKLRRAFTSFTTLSNMSGGL